ncbi:paraneoplastic antigen Ma6E-like [Orycteropus afer afer]|uniref:Paraneoplastic antigen Ma6E-like n=1 Tax=Orycteropus afer afer TaxID=1230840 RepID=A0A8B7BAJ0_ORYAF|nr:paraneoplastic antigen Ma6E-like [Orycteropus afer afer]
MTLAMLRDWCRWMGVNEQHCLLLVGIPDDCEEDEFQEAVWTALRPLGRYRLRPFSGREEPGPGEEPFEGWLDHAYDMLYLWRHVPERERRRRLVECLSGPALDILCGLLAEDPSLTAQDCLVALMQVFGAQDALMTAQFKFLTCTQQPGESLFAYVMRQEGLLQAATEKGAVHPAMADQVRARQLLMRAHLSPMLYNRLRRMRMEGRPPGLLGLLQLIQETEALEAAQARQVLSHMEEGADRGGGALAAAQAAPVDEDVTQAAPAAEEASEAVHDAEDTAEAAAGTSAAAEGIPVTQEVESAPTPAQVGGASGAHPEDAGCGPSGLA